MAEKEGRTRECIIIGAGIAGLTAAVYAARKRMDFLILSTDFGGQFNVSGEVLNYPGIVKTTGAEFSEKMLEQMKFNDVDVKQETVQAVEKLENDNFNIKTNKNEYRARAIIICSGARARKLNVPGEKGFANKGVTYCSVCDGPLFKGKKVAVIGGGNSGFEAADFMLNIAEKIYLLDAADEPNAQEYLVERINGNDKVEYINEANIKEIRGDKFVKGLKYEKDRKEHDIEVEGVIIEIGRVPNTGPFRELVKTDEHGHIIINQNTETSAEGAYAAGDCASGGEYQYCIAAGQGCMALLKAARYLAKKEG
ncbi:MAG: FAD-dependent oxidoreductase [Candidatus Woesearchaeota archaeon]